MIIYAIVGVTGLAGMLHAPWWAALAGACLLVLTLTAGHRHGVRLDGVDAATSDMARVMSSVINGSVAAALAFLAGRGSALMWGL